MNPGTRQKLEARLRYYEDLGIRTFYRDRISDAGVVLRVGAVNSVSIAQPPQSEVTRAPERQPVLSAPFSMPKSNLVVPKIPEPSLFDAANRIEGDTLERIRQDIGDDCRRCTLCRKRKTIVFGDGNPHAELLFAGEGPGADEDEQGLPFVGRAGKLLTQMIEAMGLKRSDVYICNVVKCRPPDNRLPDKEEIAECSPFLLRQIAAIRPKVVVSLGACATQTLLGSSIGITKIHGEWFDWQGTKLMPIFHPAYLLRNPPAKPEAWKDLQKVMAYLGLKSPPKKAESRR